PLCSRTDRDSTWQNKAWSALGRTALNKILSSESQKLLQFGRRREVWPWRDVFRRRGLLRSRWLSHGQIFAHFLQPLRSQAADSEQVVYTLKRPVRLAHLQNLLC